MSNATSSSGPRLAEFVFVAFNSRAAALDRETGRIIWDWQSPKGRGFVALLLDGDHLMASVDGYTYCLDAATGRQRWENHMAGFGTGVPTLASVRGTSLGSAILEESSREVRRRA